jgi:hypothetical protein
MAQRLRGRIAVEGYLGYLRVTQFSDAAPSDDAE